MAEFVGRGSQLTLLAEELERVRTGDERPGRMLAMRGRRQVGKSTLVEEFIVRSGANAVFYVASGQTAERELELFREAIATSPTEAGEIARSGPLGSWEAALGLLAREATPQRPLVIVVDEFPYLIGSSPAIEGIFQKAWDRTLEKANVLLLLVGSDLSMMEALSEYGRPLHGRFREVVIPPLSPPEVAEMLKLGAAPALDAYLVIGGFPRLAALWRSGETIWKFLRRELNDPTSALAVIGERSMSAEFPADLHARRVLEAIGSGERAFSAIATRAGVEQTALVRSLKTLQDKRVISRMTPYSSNANARATRYVVADPYLRFWLRFVSPSLELIQRGRGDVALDRVRATWSDYRGRAIEPVVREALEQMLPDKRFAPARFVGGYWTRDNRVEIDLVGGRDQSRSDVIDFVGSIKWQERARFDRDDLATLLAHRGAVPGASAKTLLVGVSRAGFATDALDVAIGPDDLLAAWRR